MWKNKILRLIPQLFFSDSFGEDIGETGSEESGSHGSEDKYESDFIDDDDAEISPPPRRANGCMSPNMPLSFNFDVALMVWVHF